MSPPPFDSRREFRETVGRAAMASHPAREPSDPPEDPPGGFPPPIHEDMRPGAGSAPPPDPTLQRASGNWKAIVGMFTVAGGLLATGIGIGMGQHHDPPATAPVVAAPERDDINARLLNLEQNMTAIKVDVATMRSDIKLLVAGLKGANATAIAKGKPAPFPLPAEYQVQEPGR